MLDKFTHEINKGRHQYQLRIKVPGIYADGLIRLNVYQVEENGPWFATVNAERVAEKVLTANHAAEAIVMFLNCEMIATLQAVTCDHLLGAEVFTYAASHHTTVKDVGRPEAGDRCG